MSDHQYTLLLFIALMCIGSLVCRGPRKASPARPSQFREITKDPTALLGAAAVALAFALPVVEASLVRHQGLRLHTIIPGMVVIIIGFAINYSANREIGRSWSPSLEKTSDQSLVTTGIYAAIRHPLYLSGLLLGLGVNIYFGSRWAWLALLPASIIMLFRIPREERALEERFKEEYLNYKKRTKAVLPWIL